MGTSTIFRRYNDLRGRLAGMTKEDREKIDKMSPWSAEKESVLRPNQYAGEDTSEPACGPHLSPQVSAFRKTDMHVSSIQEAPEYRTFSFAFSSISVL